jgi:hypothetical protein
LNVEKDCKQKMSCRKKISVVSWLWYFLQLKVILLACFTYIDIF